MKRMLVVLIAVLALAFAVPAMAGNDNNSEIEGNRNTVIQGKNFNKANFGTINEGTIVEGGVTANGGSASANNNNMIGNTVFGDTFSPSSSSNSSVGQQRPDHRPRRHL